eukprot:gene12138-12224_t
MTHSSFDAAPGLLIWHSRDLVNWTPLCTALPKPLGTVFACDLVKHGGRYFLYIPFMRAPWSTGLASFANTYVIHADAITGPWSDPVDLGIGGYIDPGHVVDSDGQRYLYLSGVSRVPLAPDGLSTTGPVEPAYDGWHYPDDWIVEGYSLEGPKLLRRGAWFYLISAVGGTGGPPTGHMVIAARSKSARGPWENCPHNPIVRTASADEPWHSRGHATAVEGPGGQWYLVYHGYENGYRTLGRQTLLEPIGWTADGWPVAQGGDLSRPLPMAQTALAGPPLLLSDDFAADAIGTRWTLHLNAAPDATLARVHDGALVLRARGSAPGDATVLTQQIGERAYEISVTVELDEGAEGGLLLWFSDRLFLGIGHDGQRMITYGGGRAGYWREPAPATRRIHLRVTNDHHIVTYWWSLDGKAWNRHAVRAEASGCHANTMQDLSSLRPALYAARQGTVRFSAYRLPLEYSPVTEFVKNLWYMAAWSDEIPAEGWLTRRLLDRPWLLWRTTEGRAVMQADRCPHRFVPISRGRREGDRVICGYHGLTFGSDGRCVHNPFGGPVPDAARLETPLVAERHGALWFWPGDPSRADAALIPDFAFIDQGAPVERAGHVMEAAYQLIADNLMDLSHAEFLHVESFGTNGSLMSHGTQTVTTEADGAIWNKWDIRDAPPPGWAAPMLGEGQTVDQSLHIRWHAPASMALEIRMARSGSEGADLIVPPMANPHILTPETATTTHYFFTHLPGEAEAAMARRVFLEEDEPMIRAQQDAMAGQDFWDARPVILPSDAAAIRVRRRMMQLLRAERTEAAADSD